MMQVSNSFVCLFLVFTIFDTIAPVCALAPRHSSHIFMTKKIKRKLEQRVISEVEMQKFVPVHKHLAALEDKSCTVSPKTGFWMVGCFADKDPNSVRVTYSGEEPMTPEVCFNFCKFQGRNSFFMLKHGRDCSCAKYYHKGSKGGLGGCSNPCDGDKGKYCGGDAKETVYEMHDCNAAAYKPTNKNEAFDAAIELTGHGVKFFMQGRELTTGLLQKNGTVTKTNQTALLQTESGSQRGLQMKIIDPRSALVKEERVFMLDGYTGQDGVNAFQAPLAREEAFALRDWVNDLANRNDIVMAAADVDAFNPSFLFWGSDVEAALMQLGCPQWTKPQQGQGYAAICAGHSDGSFSSATITGGHIAMHGGAGTLVEAPVFYRIDCEVSAWVNYGDCSLSCAGGLQAQHRDITIEPAHGGTVCPEDYERYVPCEEDPCPVDCGYTEWSGWGGCLADCGPGEQTKARSVLNYALHGGVECDESVQNTEQRQDCQIVPCPIHAEWAEWGDYGDCSEFCGPGEHQRFRERSVHAQYGGNDVEGPFDEYAGCQVKPCPIACEVSAWADSGDCSHSCGTGQMEQDREVTQVAMHDGEECPSDMTQMVPCNAHPCPIDCAASDWSDEGGCSLTCGGGQQLATRYITTPVQFGGQRCPRTLEEYSACNVDPCPVDGVWTSWSTWKPCSKDCGPGSQVRDRFAAVEPLHGGLVCEGPEEEERDCEVVPCPIDCEWDEWGDYNECQTECGDGRQGRNRIIGIHENWGGNPCEGPTYEERDCEGTPCPTDCEIGEWKNVAATECDRQCGGGEQMQDRAIINEAAHGGSCPTELTRKVACNEHACAIECEMSNFADNGDCSVTCGGGEMQQARYAIVSAANGAEACPTDNTRAVACGDEPCPVSCVWSTWSGWSACSTYCGPGEETRSRRIETPASYGGVECVGVDLEEATCQARECPIDAEWDEWSDWATCDEACGPGMTSRGREVAVYAAHGGNDAQGRAEDEQECQIVPCPIDCEVTQWEKTGDCSVSCGGGLQDWTREVSLAAQHGGGECPSDLTRQEICKSYPCPVDCEVSDWATDGDCSKTCGGGQQAERMAIQVAPSNGGAMCPSQLTRHVACGEDPCPVNCQWDSWTGWTMCSISCGEGDQSRHRGHFTAVAHGGIECTGDDRQERNCQVVPCPINCEWEDWTDFSVCDEVCGPGNQERSRGRRVEEEYGGSVCEGWDSEMQDCETAPCPVDCEIGEWGATGTCSQSCGGGSLTEEREIMVHGAHEGNACPADLVRDVACNEGPCPIDCVLSGWANDGTCSQSCGGGVLRQARSALVAPAHNGLSCHPQRERWNDCNTDACPIDCSWGQWGGWTACSAACGDGMSERARTKTTLAAHGGVDCNGDGNERQECTTVPCPIDGEWGVWADWSECDAPCGFGWQTRSRPVDVAPANGGTPVEGPSDMEQACKIVECPIDCEVSAWEQSGDCSTTCGGGAITETRTIASEAQHEGEACPTEMEREVVCNDNPCPVDCVIGEWGAVSSCSVTCGGGTFSERRELTVVPTNGGAACSAPFQRDIECNNEPCPVDCLWGQWTGFGHCSTSCGLGEQERSREVAVEEADGGVACEGAGSDTRECEISSCPIACEWSEWADWAVCSEECGPGDMRRPRSIEIDAQFGGAPCEGQAYEDDECEIVACPIDCVIGEWADAGSCSTSCGGGLLAQERPIHTAAQYSGVACPTDLTREISCAEGPCPVDCVLGDWANDGSCSVTCGGGQVQQVMTVLVQPANFGAECSMSEEERMQTIDCNENECPVDCVFGPWSGWEECSHTCGRGGIRGRDRTEAITAAFGGEACAGASLEEMVCNEFNCPVDCVWAEWAEWGVCDESCGPGISDRIRYKETSAAFGGMECDGMLREQRACQVVECPVDCEMSAWANDTDAECSVTCGGGLQAQSRTVMIQDAFGGTHCPASQLDVNVEEGAGDHSGDAVEQNQEIHRRTIPCGESFCPIDCVLSEWTTDNDCTATCGNGQESLRRHVETMHAHGGVACPDAEHVDRLKLGNCNEHACPVDCVITEWSGWGACSHTCGSGSAERSREIHTEAAHEGVACPSGGVHATQDCHVVECPINCEMGAWAEWGECDSACGPGSHDRTRSVTTPAQFGGEVCEGGLVAAEDCEIAPCPVDCELSEWANDGECSLTCGGGEQHQTRTVDTEALHGGEECEAAREQSLPCNEDNCPVDCVLTEWTEDGTCSASCGGGELVSIKTVTTAMAHGGVACPAVDSTDRHKTDACNTDACPIDCVISEWTAWTDCSLSCEEGTKTRDRSETTAMEHNGVACPTEREESSGCNEGPCPVDCVVAEWAAWSSCTASCGVASDGSQQRERTVATQDLHGGLACPVLLETREECPDITPCPVDCELSDWTESEGCTVTCGGGTQIMSRSVDVAAAHGGIPCGHLQESLVCNAQECPIDCDTSDWALDGTCTIGCGGGLQHYRKYVTVHAQHGGVACPADDEMLKQELCNQHTCPGNPAGEAGSAKMSMANGGGSKTITLNNNFATMPVVVAGPIPARGGAGGPAATSVISSVILAPAPVAAPADEQSTQGEAACECTGGPSNMVPMGSGNTQFLGAYGDYCSAWSPRDPNAAAAQARGDTALVYLGEGYAYNPATAMRIEIAGIVPAANLVVGQPVVIPSGVNVPDAEASSTSFPTNSEEWCYVDAACSAQRSDGWHTWAACQDSAGNPVAWDSRPALSFPEANVCPITGYSGDVPTLSLLARKENLGRHDICVGKDELNECHDESSMGGFGLGLVSSVKMSDDMVMLHRCYNEEAHDTCVYPEGEKDTFCKATAGSYGDDTELGYIFGKDSRQEGILPIEGKWSANEADSCAGVPGTDKDTCWGDEEMVGSMGYLLDEAAADAWAECGKQARTEDKWQITLETHVNGELRDTDPNNEKVSWFALAPGVYESTDGTHFQTGIALVPPDGAMHLIEFHETMAAAPSVVANVVSGGATPHLRQREADTAGFNVFVHGATGDHVQVHWMAIEAKDGYLSSYPFSSAVEDGVGEDGLTIEWSSHQFTQTPLVFASVATDRDDAAEVELRLAENTPGEMTITLEGSSTAEKVSYLVYNGRSSQGSGLNAVPLLLISYDWSVGAYDECGSPGSNPRQGSQTRTVECRGNNGRAYGDQYCAGTRPQSEESCCLPLVEADFEAGSCDSRDDGCGGVIALPTCTYEWSLGSWGSCSVTVGPGSQYRSASCIRSDGVGVSDMFCGVAAATSTACCNPKAASVFNTEGLYCGDVSDLCGGTVTIGTCSTSELCTGNTCVLSIVQLGCGDTADSNYHIQAGDVGTTYEVNCPAQCASGAVWGCDPGYFTSDSSICKAARTANHNGGTFEITIQSGQSSYNTCTEGGVTTSSYGSWARSVEISTKVYPEVTLTCGESAISHSGIESRTAGGVYTVNCPANCQTGSVWGCNAYTDDSSVCKAAWNAGYNGGTFDLAIIGPLSSYASCNGAWGVTSGYGSWGGSYQILPSSKHVEAIEIDSCSTHLQGFASLDQTAHGTTYRVNCIAGCGAAGNAVWGSSPYTGDSSICKAAANAGHTNGGSFDLTIENAASISSYAASGANGVSTYGYGTWSYAYSISGR